MADKPLTDAELQRLKEAGIEYPWKARDFLRLPPKGSKNKTAATGDSGASQKVSSKSSKKANGSAKSANGGFRLFVDCMPSKGGQGTVLFEDYVAPLEDVLDDEVRNREEDSAPGVRWLKYNEPRAMFRSYLQEYLKEEPLEGDVVVSSRYFFSDEVQAVLIPRASEVVKGR